MKCPNCKNEIGESYINTIPWNVVISQDEFNISHLILHTKTLHCESCNKDIKISVEYPVVNSDQIKVEII